MMKFGNLSAAVLSAFMSVVVVDSIVLANELAVVNVDELNVRSGPGISYPAVYIVGRGTRVEVVRRNGTWAYVQGLSRSMTRPQGWVFLPYLSFETAQRPTPLPSPVPGDPSGGPQETVMQFETATYSVRVYREPSGTARMNVFNRGTAQTVLSGAPAANNVGADYNEYSACTTNRTNCDGTRFTARLEDSGQRSLNIRQQDRLPGITETAR